VSLRLPAWDRRRWLLTLVLVAPLLGLVGVTAAELVPDGRIASHLVAALDRGELTPEDRTTSMLGTTADHYAECAAVTVGLGDDDGTVLRRALFSPAAYGCVPAVGMLAEFAATGVLPPRPDYMRYWHGYAVFTRPALAVFGLAGTRWLAIAVLVLAVGGFCRCVSRRFGAPVAALAVVPALMTTDMVTGGWSISQSIGMATAWAGGWLVLAQTSRERTWQLAALTAALAGAINAYFDLMVAIPASLALCAVAAGLATTSPGRGVELRSAATIMGSAVAGWAAGLGGMWASKWVFAWLFVDRDQIVDSVRDQVEFRTGGDYEGVTGTRLTGFTKNVEYFLDQPLAPPVLLAIAAALGIAVWAWRGSHADWWTGLRDVTLCMLVAAAPFALWYVALDNHNQIHVWQTYRSVAVAAGALAAFAFATLHGGTSSLASMGNGVDGAITPEPSEERDPTPHPPEGVSDPH
jgi:hypothetical protein